MNPVRAQSPVFKFKQFEINQSASAMKVGTDGVLVAAWAQSENTETILDIGSGTGLIGLMLCQRFTHARVTGIEIDSSAHQESADNIARSPWPERMVTINTDIQSFADSHEQTFGLIVSNPPFYTSQYLPALKQRGIARHTDTLAYKDLIRCAHKLLAENGSFCLILPADAQSEIEKLCCEYHLKVNRICHIKPTPDKPPKRILFSIAHQAYPLQIEEIIIEDKGRHQYSAEYKELTKDFYLAF